MPLNESPDITYTVQSSEHGDKLSASIRLPLIKQIDWGNITAASGSSKLRGGVNKAERRKKFHKHWHLMSELEKRKKKKHGINTLTPRGSTVVYVKYQITITFTGLPEAHDSIIWAETTYYRIGVMDVVCLFCGQFAELMLFAVQCYCRENEMASFDVCPFSFWQSSSVLQPGSVQSKAPWNILESTKEGFIVKETYISSTTLPVHPPSCCLSFGSTRMSDFFLSWPIVCLSCSLLQLNRGRSDWQLAMSCLS